MTELLLHRLAATQCGYFTAGQALRAGCGHSLLHYHVRRGRIVRVGFGMYRDPLVPRDGRHILARLSLWSHDRDGRAQAIVSHDTAQRLHGMGPAQDRRVHLTVPARFRKPAPPWCVLHVSHVDDEDRESWGSFEVTTPGRTYLDVSARPGLPEGEQLRLLQLWFCVEQARAELDMPIAWATGTARARHEAALRSRVRELQQQELQAAQRRGALRHQSGADAGR